MKTSCIFIDVRKAFDSVDHRILISKMKKIGFRDDAIKLLESYLQNRKQFIFMQGISSNQKLIKRGVPQGSILGAILFLIYINDLFNLNWQGCLQLYADDASIVYEANSYTLLREKNA